jgi:hypothetical protein
MLDSAISEVRHSIVSLTCDCWKWFGLIGVTVVGLRLFKVFWKMVERVDDSSRKKTDPAHHRQEGTWLFSDALLCIPTPFHA